MPPAGGSRRGARLRGNGDRGTCLTEGGSFTPPSSGFNGEYDKQSACSLMGKTLAFCRAREVPSHSLQSFKKYKLNLSKFVLNLFADFVQSFFFDAGNVASGYTEFFGYLFLRKLGASADAVAEHEDLIFPWG